MHPHLRPVAPQRVASKYANVDWVPTQLPRSNLKPVGGLTRIQLAVDYRLNALESIQFAHVHRHRGQLPHEDLPAQSRESALNAGDALNPSVTVTNTGNLPGDEVVQLYLKFPNISGAPIRALRGFQRLHLAPGASQKVEFHLNSRDLSMVTDTGDILVAQGKYTLSIGGGQPGTGVPAAEGDFEVKGQLLLPE